MSSSRPNRHRPSREPLAAGGGFGAGSLLFALVALTAIVAWLAGNALVRRAQAASLPALPEAAGLEDAVRADLRAADTAARADPTSALAVGELGMAYHASLLMAPAEQAYGEAAHLALRDPRWSYYLGLLREERGEQDAALHDFERVTTLDPRHGLAWFHLAEIAFKRDEKALARQAYEQARDAPPQPPFLIDGRVPRQSMPLAAYAILGLARLSIESGDARAAAASLEALTRDQPRFGVARTLLRQLRDTPAADLAERSAVTARAYVPPADPRLDALVARSHQTDLLLKHAALAARGGDQVWREFLVRRALAAAPVSLDVLLEMASLLQSQRRHAEALDYLRKCEQVAPGDHHTLVEQGKVLSELGRLDEAEQVLRRAVRVRDAAAEYNLGTVLDRQGRWEDARAGYERALAIDPFHSRAMNNLAAGLDRHGETAAALALYERALRVSPDDAEVLTNLGTALINQRRFGEAVLTLERAIALDTTAAAPRNNLGIALARLNRSAEAAAQFERALALDPGHADARRNLEALRLVSPRQP